MRWLLLAALVAGATSCGGDGRSRAGGPAVFEIDATGALDSSPPSPVDLGDWAAWSVSSDGRLIAAAPYRRSGGGWVLDTQAKTFTALGDVRLVSSQGIVTFDIGTRTYTDLETRSAYGLPAAEQEAPKYEAFSASNGVLARLGRDSDDQPGLLLVWYRGASPTWSRALGAGYRDAGAALSPDGELIGVVEENSDDHLDVTLLAARDGRERWKTTLRLRNTVPSTQVSLPIMFSPDGASLYVGGNAALRPPGPAYTWVDVDVATGRAGRGTGVELLGGTTDRHVSTAGLSKGVLWSASVIQMSASHTTPGVEWTCNYHSVDVGRERVRVRPERDEQLRAQVTGAGGGSCPTRAIRATAGGALVVVRLVGARVRVLTWTSPPS